MDTPQLVTMLKALRNGDPVLGWPPGRALEYVVLRGFEIEGAEVKWPYQVMQDDHVIEQIDGFVYCDGLYCLVESKDYSEAIDIGPITKLRHQLARRPSNSLGIVFARSGFTDPMKLQMRMLVPLNVLLWEIDELETAIRKQHMRTALQLKFKQAVQFGVPDANVKREVS
jgi:hypothetical protein